MKNIIILFALIFLCFIVKAQTKVDKLLIVKVPQGTEMPTKEMLSDYLKFRKKSQFTTSESFSGSTYKSGNILFKINVDTGVVPIDRIKTYKAEKDKSSKLTQGINYSSELKTFNNIPVVILHYESPEFGYYRFMSVNNSNTKILFASMEYPKSDEVKAQTMLNYILNHLKFK